MLPAVRPGPAGTSSAVYKALFEAEFKVSPNKGRGSSLITAPKKDVDAFLLNVGHERKLHLNRAQLPALPGQSPAAVPAAATCDRALV